MESRDVNVWLKCSSMQLGTLAPTQAASPSHFAQVPWSMLL